MTIFFTIFLIEDTSVCLLKDNNSCIQQGTQIVATMSTRIADTKNRTIRMLVCNEKYTLPMMGWVISPYTTYHDEHLRHVRRCKGNVSYDYVCFLIDAATERLQKLEPEKRIEIYAKERWLRYYDIAVWVDSVLNDWILNYSS